VQLTSPPGGPEEFAAANNTVPSPLAQALTQFEYEFLNYLRSKRFYILLAIVVAIGAAITGTLYYYRPSVYLSSPLAFYSVWWGSVAGLPVLLSAVFYGAEAISTEFQNKTGYYLLPNPVNRSSIYFGKFLAAFVASVIAVAVFAAITMADASIYFGAAVPIQFAESLLFTIIYILPMLGVSFFLSSVFKNNSYSILMSVMVLWIGFSYLSPLIVTFTGTEPWYLLSYGGQIIGNAVRPSGYPTHVVIEGVTASYATTIPEGLVIMLGYLVVFAILGLFLFEHKDFD
jgi:ABC-type transport system involved in multi-copper enzyme maturation permease subunit